MPTRVDPQRLRQAARMYRSVTDAASAVGINRATFTRLCKEHGIATPWQRRSRSAACGQEMSR